MAERSMLAPEMILFQSWMEARETISDCVRQQASNAQRLRILEAGCGRHWDLKLDGVAYELTGVDRDPAALAARKDDIGDLDIAVHGDLSTVDLAGQSFDVIYSSYVLEHIDGAEAVLRRFVQWLAPNGIMIIKIPDGDSVLGFVARITPFWFHVFYKKYIQRVPNAGKPGHDPYPTCYDRVISQRGMREFCQRHHLTIEAQYGYGYYVDTLDRIFRLPMRIVLWCIHLLSGRRLAINHTDLCYVIRKPA
jgi:SAM-dependent methyltransferase